MKTTWLAIIILLSQQILSQKYCENLLKTRTDESALIEDLGKNMHIAKTESNR
jgi:hypothetical protein